jgi:hypothetical protein
VLVGGLSLKGGTVVCQKQLVDGSEVKIKTKIKLQMKFLLVLG